MVRVASQSSSTLINQALAGSQQCQPMRALLFMLICFQADTSVLHTPPTMCVCVPVSSGAKSIDETARYAVSPPATITFTFTWAAECRRSKANESVQVIESIGSGHPHCAHVYCWWYFFYVSFFSEGKGDTVHIYTLHINWFYWNHNWFSSPAGVANHQVVTIALTIVES